MHRTSRRRRLGARPRSGCTLQVDREQARFLRGSCGVKALPLQPSPCNCVRVIHADSFAKRRRCRAWKDLHDAGRNALARRRGTRAQGIFGSSRGTSGRYVRVRLLGPCGTIDCNRPPCPAGTIPAGFAPSTCSGSPPRCCATPSGRPQEGRASEVRHSGSSNRRQPRSNGHRIEQPSSVR
jgi:hypothetical protein